MPSSAEPGKAGSEGDKDEVCLKIDTRVFSQEAVLRALYWFGKELYSEVTISEDSAHLVVRLRPKQRVPTLENPKPPNMETLVGELQNAIVDSELRVQMQKETSGVRELILAKAFSEAGVLEDPPPATFDDPVLAARPKRPEESLLKILS